MSQFTTKQRIVPLSPLFCDMVKHKLRVESLKPRVESLKPRVEIQKCEFTKSRIKNH